VLRQGLGLALGLQLRIGIGFRRNHSWSSTFTPRRNHSLCLKYNATHVQLRKRSKFDRVIKLDKIPVERNVFIIRQTKAATVVSQSQ